MATACAGSMPMAAQTASSPRDLSCSAVRMSQPSLLP